jgi:hypothetical protein
VLCLIGLSAYPNLISGHAFGGKGPIVHVTTASTTVDIAATSCVGSATNGSCQSPLKKTYSTSQMVELDPATGWVRYAP